MNLNLNLNLRRCGAAARTQHPVWVCDRRGRTDPLRAHAWSVEMRGGISAGSRRTILLRCVAIPLAECDRVALALSLRVQLLWVEELSYSHAITY